MTASLTMAAIAVASFMQWGDPFQDFEMNPL
jgi:hypothetical protein